MKKRVAPVCVLAQAGVKAEHSVTSNSKGTLDTLDTLGIFKDIMKKAILIFNKKIR